MRLCELQAVMSDRDEITICRPIITENDGIVYWGTVKDIPKEYLNMDVTDIVPFTRPGIVPIQTYVVIGVYIR